MADSAQIVSRLKQFGREARTGGRGVSGINVESDARALVNDLERYPHAFVLACVADRQAPANIAWDLPHKIRKEARDFEFDTLVRLPATVWDDVLAASGHPLAADMRRLLPAAIELIADRYGGDAARIWAKGSSGAAVVRRFLEFDGVRSKIANMAANILARDFRVRLIGPMPDIAVDTHVLRVFKRLGLLRPLTSSRLSQGTVTAKEQIQLQYRARELNPDWPGEIDWPVWKIGHEWCHARKKPACGECSMAPLCPSVQVR